MTIDTIEIWEQSYNETLEQSFVERHGHVNEITVGTVLEYDDWQWALVTELATGRDEPMIGFVLLDELGDAFVRWAPWGDERIDDDLWKVTDIEWQYKTTWITDRDDPTTRRDHRVYVLTSRETFDEVRQTEEELIMGDWRLKEEIDG